MEMTVTTAVREVIEVIEVIGKETMMMTHLVEVVVPAGGILTTIPFRKFHFRLTQLTSNLALKMDHKKFLHTKTD